MSDMNEGLSALSRAAQDVLAERKRQIDVEGWTAEHDDQHCQGELAELAAHYAIEGSGISGWLESGGAEVRDWFNPKREKRQNLVVAGALILAEIERLDRRV